MSSLRQIEANRRNAQKSTGPTSVTGKAASSMNALKTGIHAQTLILPSENLADLEQLIESFYHHHRPATPDARAMVDELIYCEWNLRRLRAAETQLWKYHEENSFHHQDFPLGHAASVNPTAYTRLQYRMDATRRARARALEALEKLKSKPVPPVEAVEPPSLIPSLQTTSPQIGFLPPTLPSPTQTASLTHRGIINVDGVQRPVPAGGRSFESFPVDR